MEIFKGVSPWFLSNNPIFDQGYFRGKLSEKRPFFDTLNRKEWFLD